VGEIKKHSREHQKDKDNGIDLKWKIITRMDQAARRVKRRMANLAASSEPNR
jgi:hypothetical protein